MRSRRLLFATGVIVAAAAAAWFASPLLSGSIEAPEVVSGGPTGRSLQLAISRKTADPNELDTFVIEQRRLAEESARPGHWRVLAEAFLERAQLRDNRKGMRVGTPTHSELPPANATDLEEGLKCIAKARELGDATSEAHRIEAGLLSQKIVSQWSALKLRGRIQSALRKALDVDPENPRVLIALGCEKLFAPGILGGDPDAAREMLIRAADAIEVDERPLVFAAMAAYLNRQKDLARELLIRALERNEHNLYARIVLRRLRQNEDEPFGRDV